MTPTQSMSVWWHLMAMIRVTDYNPGFPLWRVMPYKKFFSN